MSTRRNVVYSLAHDYVLGPTRVSVAIVRCQELREASSDDLALEAAVSRLISVLLAMAGRFDEAREVERRATPLLEEKALKALSWGSLDMAAYGSRLAGDVAGAERYLEQKWHTYPPEDGKTERLAINGSIGLANLYCDEGRWEEAEAVLAVHRHDRGETPIAEARVAAHRGRFDEALALARGIVAAREPTDTLNIRANGWVALAEVERAAGLSADADASVERALRLFEQKGNVAELDRLRATALI
jgi:tetratricopeptide (TPR) repeat protein